jgi:hypothetical protein
MSIATKLAAIAAALILCSPSALAQTPASPPAPQPAKQIKQAKPAAPRGKQPAPPAQQAAPTGKSVCVASLIGHKFHVQTIGMMVFGNKLDEPNIESWGIDDLAVRKVAAVLSGKGFAVRKIEFPKANLAALEGRVELFHNRENDLIAGLRAGAGAGKCEFVIAIVRGALQHAGTNQWLAGLGILKHDGLLQQFMLFANFNVTLYNGSTFERIRTRRPSTNPRQPGTVASLSGMSRTVDKSWWPGDGPGAVQSAQLRTAMRDFVEQGVAQVVPELFFTEDPALTAETQPGGGANYIGGRND